ncbi:MAG: molybdate ABC transporter substrate-binding protein [Lentisphaeraceae bacterium]|nr:molybdate ABC transporter substrate-binding protein [Lentisphaeraceae bacterium]
MKMTYNSALIALICLVISCQPKSDALRVAVASNFLKPCQALVAEFSKTNSTKVDIISASTGKIFTLIENGAKYDIFLSADLERPKILANNTKYDYFIYAYGRLAIWNSSKLPILNSLHKDFKKIAIANPKLAPYGKASQEVLSNKELLSITTKMTIFGENVNQAYIFAKTESKNAAFIPLYTAKNANGFFLELPEKLHSRIVQAAIRLTDSKASQKFENFLKSSKAKKIIKEFDYEVSDD